MNEEYEAPIYGLSYGMVARVSVALGGILAVAVVNAAMWEQPFLGGRWLPTIILMYAGGTLFGRLAEPAALASTAGIHLTGLFSRAQFVAWDAVRDVNVDGGGRRIVVVAADGSFELNTRLAIPTHVVVFAYAALKVARIVQRHGPLELPRLAPWLHGQKVYLKGASLIDQPKLETLYADEALYATQVRSPRLPDQEVWSPLAMRFVIRTMDDSRLVGAIELLVNAESLTGSIGYSLASTHWNRGLMTEAVGLLTREATSVWHLRQIRARCSATNLASRKVLERNGFTLSGVHPNDEWVNVRFEDTCHYVYRGPRDQLGQA